MRRLLRDDSGAMLVLVALLLPAMLGMAGVALDASHLYVQRRRMQGIADLAAVGGAMSLPTQPGKARQRVREVAAANGFTHGTGSRWVQATTPYQDDPLLLHVELRDSVPSVFIQMLGIQKSELRVSAVARAAAKPPVIFASSTNCATKTEKGDTVPFYWGGSDADIAIPFHSNGSMVLAGNNNTFRSPITYGCKVQINSGNTVTSTVTKVDAKPLPFAFDPNSWTCTFRVVNTTMDLGDNTAPWWDDFNASPRRLKPGVYCADGGKIKLKVSNVAGNVTLRATDNIELAAGDLRLTAYVDNVLAYSSRGGGEAITISGSGGRMAGLIQGDRGLVRFTGKDNIVLNGSIVGRQVTVSGQYFYMTAPPGGRARLVQ